MTKATIGFAMCGSFCTFSKAFEQMEALVRDGFDVIPIMSENACTTDTRFGAARDMVQRAEAVTGRRVLCTAVDTEPIGPKNLCDLLIIAPCTGNTLAKLAHSIADTSVTMAAKSHLRNGRPVIVAISSNDALAGAAENIGKLMGRKNYYFVPFRQDDAIGKPTSIVAEFSRIPEALEAALAGKQLQPMLLSQDD